jgi:hypothetical protein
LRVLENRVLRRTFGPMRDEVTREWRRIHNEKLYAQYSSPDIIRVIKSRRLRLAGHVVRMWERKGRFCWGRGKPEGRRPLERLRHSWEVILKWILQKWNVGNRLDRADSGLGLVVGSCGCGNEHSGCIKCWEFLE